MEGEEEESEEDDYDEEDEEEEDRPKRREKKRRWVNIPVRTSVVDLHWFQCGSGAGSRFLT
jgi:hypothetical protein